MEANILPTFNQISPTLYRRSSKFASQIALKDIYDVIRMQHCRDSFEIPTETTKLLLHLV